MQIRNRLLLLTFGAALALGTAGCGGREESTAEKMGEALEEAGEDIGDAAEDAADEIGDAAEEAKEEVEEAIE
jgi:hypothetical protein